MEKYAPVIGSSDHKEEVALARELGALFFEQYKRVKRLAEVGDS